MKSNPFIPIDVLSAEVSTATIEIRTLTIGRKQVTLAVFRQLDQEDLVDPADASLNGVPWGRVNYHPSQACSGYGEHLHVVWQKGAELRRSTVTRTWPLTRHAADTLTNLLEEIGVEALDPYLLALLAAGQDVSPLRYEVMEGFDAAVTVNGVRIVRRTQTSPYHPEQIAWPWFVSTAMGSGDRGRYSEYALQELDDSGRPYLVADGALIDGALDSLRQQLDARLATWKRVKRDYTATERTYQAVYHELGNLPLLFIAV